MDANIQKLIQETIKTQGWKYIEQILRDDFLEGSKPINFKTDGKSNEVVASECRARELSAKAISSFIRKINNLKNGRSITPESYV